LAATGFWDRNTNAMSCNCKKHCCCYEPPEEKGWGECARDEAMGWLDAIFGL